MFLFFFLFIRRAALILLSTSQLAQHLRNLDLSFSKYYAKLLDFVNTCYFHHEKPPQTRSPSLSVLIKSHDVEISDSTVRYNLLSIETTDSRAFLLKPRILLPGPFRFMLAIALQFTLQIAILHVDITDIYFES